MGAVRHTNASRDSHDDHTEDGYGHERKGSIRSNLK